MKSQSRTLVQFTPSLCRGVVEDAGVSFMEFKVSCLSDLEGGHWSRRDIPRSGRANNNRQAH